VHDFERQIFTDEITRHSRALGSYGLPSSAKQWKSSVPVVSLGTFIRLVSSKPIVDYASLSNANSGSLMVLITLLNSIALTSQSHIMHINNSKVKQYEINKSRHDGFIVIRVSKKCELGWNDNDKRRGLIFLDYQFCFSVIGCLLPHLGFDIRHMFSAQATFENILQNLNATTINHVSADVVLG